MDTKENNEKDRERERDALLYVLPELVALLL
jgi:hypothetical protein